MNNNQNTASELHFQEPQSSGVSFPAISDSQNRGRGKTLLVVGILILIGVLGYLVYQSAAEKSVKPLSTSTPVATPVETLRPTASPKLLDKSKIKIQVQNGTGIVGEAAYLQTQLEKLGYSNITIGNAPTQDRVATSVTFAKSLDREIIEEITEKLESTYKEVEVKNASATTFDVLVVTGERKGTTPKSSPTPNPKATLKSTSTPNPSSSSSASPRPSASP